MTIIVIAKIYGCHASESWHPAKPTRGTMLPSSSEILYFLELSESLNFSRASERLGITQPSLSTAIKKLEESMGVELFIRSKKGVSLTQSGKRFLSHAKQFMEMWDTFKSATLASYFEVQGNISLGCHPSIALYTLHKFLPHLFQEYPKLEIQLKHTISRKIVEGVINLSLDLGIVVNPIKHPDLIIQKLYEDKFTLWQSSKKNSDVLICDLELSQTQWILKQLHKAGIKYNRMITSSNLEVIANLSAHGCGVGVMPASVALTMYPTKLHMVPKMPVYRDEICLIYRNENRNVKAIQIMISQIKKTKL